MKDQANDRSLEPSRHDQRLKCNLQNAHSILAERCLLACKSPFVSSAFPSPDSSAVSLSPP
jgi:hypothetical protein